MLTRPPELQEFYLKHGKPLEVGMIVKVINNKDFIEEYSVCSIKSSNLQRVEILISDCLKKWYSFSLLDLIPAISAPLKLE